MRAALAVVVFYLDIASGFYRESETSLGGGCTHAAVKSWHRLAVLAPACQCPSPQSCQWWLFLV